MNYIEEINRFYSYQIQNQLSSCEQALWHRLMAYCNSFNWANDFTLTNTRLVEDLKISRQKLDSARNCLVQKGLISYKKGNGNQCGSYHIHSLSVDFNTQTLHKPCTSLTQDLHKPCTVQDTNVTQTLPLTKHKHKRKHKRL